MIKNTLFIAFICIFCLDTSAQSIFDTDVVRHDGGAYQENFALIDSPSKRATITTPPGSPVRPMAEWEEIEAIIISWTKYDETLAEIVRHAQSECKVYINCEASAKEVQDRLDLFNVPYGDNVIFLENQKFNSVWIRDYGPNSAYLNDVDSLIFVDWVYNRELRPDDDILPAQIADQISVPLFETVEGEFYLTATGGNFMSDGISKGFSSKLIVNENADKTEAEINTIMKDFMGVESYVKFDTLVYDGIHHIDMHMKLLDEERIIFGQYPEGKGDHDIIEANIEYLLATQKNAYGEPYEIIRIPMPPDFNGAYPSDPGMGDFRTYTNALFINKTILVPTYQEKHDTTALRIWRETMPGYNIVGIDCNSLIGAYGAIHCVTKEVGVRHPLRIVFQKIKDQEESIASGYPLQAIVQHRTGIQEVTLHYREAGDEDYDQLRMQLIDPQDDLYEGFIPNFVSQGTIEYYLTAKALNGKTISRPQPAPLAYYDFEVNLKTATTDLSPAVFNRGAFPNPANGLVCIPIELPKSVNGQLALYDVHGKLLSIIHEGPIASGSSKFFINVSTYPSGIYTIRLMDTQSVFTQKLIVD